MENNNRTIITTNELAKRLANMDTNDGSEFFWVSGEECCAKYICEFDAWMIIVNVWGGGFSQIIDYAPGTTTPDQLGALVDWLHWFCNTLGSHEIEVMAEEA